MKRDLTIAAYLGVKDEVELIERSIQHLRAIGVDHIIVHDMSSTDGTLEILEKYRSDNFSYFSMVNATKVGPNEEEEEWANEAWNRYSIAPCDWVIFLDADEFWLPASGNLKDCECFYSSDLLIVDRLNVVLGAEGPLFPQELTPATYDKVGLYAKPVLNFHLAKQGHAHSTPWIRGAAEAKIAARRSKMGPLAVGQHDMEMASGAVRERPNDLAIAHLAMSTLSRFERKVANIRAIYEAAGVDLSLPQASWQSWGTAWHWRRWATLPDLSKEFRENSVDGEELAALRRSQAVMSASDLLGRRQPRLADAHLRRNDVLLELEYEATFRPRDHGLSVDPRLLAVRHLKTSISCADTGVSCGQFDMGQERPTGWRGLYGLGNPDMGGRWSVGPRSSIFFALGQAAPERIRVEISHLVSRKMAPRVPARLRVNGGEWQRVEFTGGVLGVEFDLVGDPLRRVEQDLSLIASSTPSLSILLINYNQPELTFAAVVAIRAAKIAVPYEVIVVDNGSNPISATRLDEMALPVRLIQLPERVSFGSANNIAVEGARGEFVLLLNNDAFLGEGLVEKLQEALTADGVGLVGPVFRFPDDSLQELGGFIGADGHSNSPLFNGLGWDAPEIAEVDYVSAACVMLRRADFLSVGGFDPEFEFAYSEDCDLCFRVRAAGKRVQLVTSVSVRHIRGATSSQLGVNTRLENIKLRNLNVLKSRWVRLQAQEGAEAAVRYGFDLAKLQRQIACFPGAEALNCVASDRPLEAGSDFEAVLAHASALGQIHPTLVGGPVANSVVDVADRARALGLTHERLAVSVRSELERRDVNVELVSSAACPPATTPRYGRRRILHCPVPSPEEDVQAMRRKIGNLLNFDAIVSDSEFGRRACLAWLDRLQAPPVEIDVIPGPVDLFEPEERTGTRANIIVSMGPLRPGPSGGGHEAVLRAFAGFAASAGSQRWRLVIVGALSADDDAKYVDELRWLQRQLDVDVLVSPPRSVLRRLLLRSKVFVSGQGLDAEASEDPAAFGHSIAQVGTAISAGCVPAAFHIGAAGDFCRSHKIGCVFEDEAGLTAALQEAAALADEQGLSPAQCRKMERYGPTAHHKAWASVVSRVRPAPEARTALVVVGSPRSGASAMARVLSLAGADLPSDLRENKAGEATELWELASIAEFNENILKSQGLRSDDPLAFANRSTRAVKARDVYAAYRLLTESFAGNRPFVLKDPRISLLVELWKGAFRSAQCRPKFVVMVRDPGEVTASMRASTRLPIGKGLLLWANFMLAVERDTRSDDRIFVAYEDLLSQPMATLDRIRSSLELPQRDALEEEISGFLRAPQRRTGGPASKPLPEAISRHFYDLQAACQGGAAPGGEALESWLKAAHSAPVAARR